MDTKSLTEKLVAATRGDDAKMKQLSSALLSHDKGQIKMVFHDLINVELSDAEADEAISMFGTEAQIEKQVAAFT